MYFSELNCGFSNFHSFGGDKQLERSHHPAHSNIQAVADMLLSFSEDVKLSIDLVEPYRPNFIHLSLSPLDS